MSGAKVCPQCNTEYPAEQRFCAIDGAALKTQGGGGELVGSIVAERYHVLRKLGEGGMGQVYLAEHVRMGRKSALKVMHPKMVQDAEAISRFNREAANASRINHPHVAAIYDFGETADGLIYLAMEYVEGEPLTALVARTGTLPPLRAAEIVRQTAAALGVAHDMGIVHRDLKPDNIMIARDRDGSDCVKVVDFGIAKAEGTAQQVTKTGLVVGTPEYMSPEQLAGDQLDGRSDTYSLGIVAFHLLTGKLPFPSDSVQESMIMRLTDRPRRLDETRTDLRWPAELQGVMDRVLARRADERYATAPEFARDFARAVEHIPEAAAMAAGTLVMDAGAAGVPPTREARREAGVRSREAGAAPAPRAVGSGGSGTPNSRPPTPDTVRGPATARTAILIAASILLVLGAGAATLHFMARAEGSTATVDSLAAADPAPASKTDVRQPVNTEPPPTPEQFAKAAPEPAVGAVLDRVATLTTAGAKGSESAARDAIRELNRIAGRLVHGSEDHIRAQMLRAEAHAALNQGEQMCTVLGTIQRVPDDAVRARHLQRLRQLANCN